MHKLKGCTVTFLLLTQVVNVAHASQERSGQLVKSRELDLGAGNAVLVSSWRTPGGHKCEEYVDTTTKVGKVVQCDGFDPPTKTSAASAYSPRLIDVSIVRMRALARSTAFLATVELTGEGKTVPVQACSQSDGTLNCKYHLRFTPTGADGIDVVATVLDNDGKGAKSPSHVVTHHIELASAATKSVALDDGFELVLHRYP